MKTGRGLCGSSYQAPTRTSTPPSHYATAWKLSRAPPPTPPELRQLVYFDAVVRHGGFTRAAEQLHVAQPGVSAQIRDLVSHGLGIALVPASVATAPGRPVTIHSVQPDPIQRAINLTHRKDPPLPAAAQACQDLLQRWPTATAKRRR